MTLSHFSTQMPFVLPHGLTVTFKTTGEEGVSPSVVIEPIELSTNPDDELRERISPVKESIDIERFAVCNQSGAAYID